MMGMISLRAPRAVRAFTTGRAASWMAMTLMAMTLVLVGPAVASQPLDGLLACRKVAGNAARLACFDRRSAAIAAHRATVAGRRPPASAPPAVPAQPATSGVAVAGAAASVV